MKKVSFKGIVTAGALLFAASAGCALGFAEHNPKGEQFFKSLILGEDVFALSAQSGFLMGEQLAPEIAQAIAEGTVELPPYQKREPEGEPVEFHEVWGYVMTGRFYEYDKSMPITDLCVFSADINSYGEISSIPSPNGLTGFTGRKHLVVTCEGYALTHMVLDPSFGVRQKIIRRLGEAVRQYDGIQIDFETIPARDAQNFISFLGDVRAQIGSAKWMSVCVPARVRLISDDLFPYAKIANYVDRVIVMAYDEHWSGSTPGSIASIDWCSRVADYAVSTIPAKKLIMGLPFYGRTWQSESPAKAWYFSGITNVLNNNDHPEVEYTNDIPNFSYETTLKVTGYFEDTYSLVQRCRMYKEKNVAKIAFWRIGQEDSDFWPWLKIN